MRRRDPAQSQLHLGVGDPFRAIAKFRNFEGALRSQLVPCPNSFGDGADGSFLIGTWPRLPEMGERMFWPDWSPSGNTELLINVPRTLF